MKNITLEDVNVQNLRESEQILVDALRTKYPHLDLRVGTALRDLLVVPDSAVHAWFSAQVEEQRDTSSLQALLGRYDSGNEIDTDDVNRVMSNFNMSGAAGTSARGVLKIVVSSPRTYIVAAGDLFDTLTGTRFSSLKTVTASENPSSDEVKLFHGSANWYFFVPVVCDIVGSSGNVADGTVFSCRRSFAGFVSATAYGDFSGGSDVENLHSIVDRIPAALSVRGMLNSTAVESVLRDRFDSGENKILAISTVGYGNPAQLRDKHNPFGVGVGGRVDVYVRNFTTPYAVRLVKECTRDPEDGSYVCDISSDDGVVGIQSVQSIADADTDAAAASYAFSTKYGSSSIDDTWHDFDVSNDATEVAGTLWRSCRVKILNTGMSSATRLFSISVVCLPGIEEMQRYVDDASVRNVGSDFVIRCPAVCRVSVNVSCRYKYGTVFDFDSAKSAIANYVNTTGFVGRLTRSEIACALKSCGATSVDIVDDYMLTGYVIDAKGFSHKLFGDSLDISDISDPSALLTKDTCVFSSSAEDINLTAIPE